MECQLENITVHYEEYGKGRPLLALHGWTVDNRHIAGKMERFFTNRDGWRRIYPDQPGMGKTRGEKWIETQDQLLEILLDFIDEVIPGQRFVVAGSSVGAYLARGLVHSRASSIDGVFLDVPVILRDRTKRTVPARITLVKDPTLFVGLDPREAEELEWLAVVQSQKFLDELRTNILPALDIADQAFASKLIAAGEFSFEVDALAEPFPAPTLILTGRQDPGVGYSDAWSILENYPRATFVVLDRAGHEVSIEQEGLFNALVSEWLDRVEEWTAARIG